MLKKFSSILLGLLISFWAISANYAEAQDQETPLVCGDIDEDEIRQDDVVSYTIQMQAGDGLHLEIVQVGDIGDLTLTVRVGPDKERIAGGDYFERLGPAEVIDLNVPFSDEYLIEVEGFRGGVGGYTLYVGCTISGTPIAPGEASVGPTEVPINPTSVPSDFYGFAGLPLVSFENAVELPLSISTPMTGAISPSGREIWAYAFDAAENQEMSLSFTRLTGNLNLGIVILSQNDGYQVVFQASVIASTNISSDLVLPVGGQYKIVVFPTDILVPPAPEPTTFQVLVESA